MVRPTRALLAARLALLIVGALLPGQVKSMTDSPMMPSMDPQDIIKEALDDIKMTHRREEEELKNMSSELSQLVRQAKARLLQGEAMGEVGKNLSQLQERVRQKVVKSRTCTERRAAGECSSAPLAMVRDCPQACDHHLVNSSAPARAVVDGVLSRDVCDQILELAPDAIKIGDGMEGRAFPFSKDEVFAGITPRAAAQWAVEQPEAWGRRTKAKAWARALLRAATEAKIAVEGSLAAPGLSTDYVQLACRQFAPTNMTPSAYSMPPHADNCYREGEDCVQAPPYFHWRSHAATLFLHGPEDDHFEGGNFFFTPHWESSNQTLVEPRAGRLVAFTSGAENIHGITKITKGARCALSVWLTTDVDRAQARDEISEARRILDDPSAADAPECSAKAHVPQGPPGVAA